VEQGPEMVEPAPDIVEQEHFEVLTSDTHPETVTLDTQTYELATLDNSPQPKDGIGPPPPPGTDSLRQYAEEPPGDPPPRHALPVKGDGCTATGTGSMPLSPLLLLLLLVSLLMTRQPRCRPERRSEGPQSKDLRVSGTVRHGGDPSTPLRSGQDDTIGCSSVDNVPVGATKTPSAGKAGGLLRSRRISPS
jgi:uncharacterized protein (TIGR03382 family)